ncbi:hypothetical protein NHX12_009537 [Muraenolepis orangiensis]|uniref:RAP80 N-terminal domain-containing protein n=1 Tax=Muraenolepis orangiensis TaxID=630683 RepID=A0A9Q0DHT2_9TELE|nr:hypothetical protein NHX12_009537 [Muraenolepis orangiensis]
MSPRKPVNKDASAFSSGMDGDGGEAEDMGDEVKGVMTQMTEEEMMDLALRLSEQEASIAAVKRQQEEEAMREALKESMFSQTQPCASPQSQTDPSPQQLPSRWMLADPAVVCQDVVSGEDLTTEAETEYDPRGPGNHKHNKRNWKKEDDGPLQELPDLSQTEEICSQSSRLDSPSSQQSLTSTQTSQPSPSKSPTFPSSATHSEHVACSKKLTFPKTRKEKQTTKTDESVPESVKMTSDMNLRWSDDGDVLSQSEMPPSPVFPEESTLQRAEDQGRSPEYSPSARPGISSNSPKCLRWTPSVPAPVAVEIGYSDTTAAATTSACPQGPQSGAGPSHTQEPSGRVSALPERPEVEPLVHYYWGVPFCPQGLDPDVYTQVILAQMEVYEKSLKHAQRSLLNKVQWGKGITPQSEELLEDSPELIPTRRRGIRCKRKQPDEKLPEEEEEDRGGKEPESMEEGEEDLDVVGCDVCPETQLSGDDTQELMMDTQEAGKEVRRSSLDDVCNH